MFVIKSTTQNMLVNTYLKLDVNWNVRSHCISYAISQENRGGNLEFFDEDWYVGGTDTWLFRQYR
jgi:hypothetical protein